MSWRLHLTARTEAWIAWAAIGVAGTLLGLVAGLNPAAAIVLALAVAFAGVVVADLTTGLLLFIGILFLEALLPGGELTLTKLAGLLLAVSWIARVTTRRDEDNFFTAHPAATYVLVAFIAWAVISLSWATDTAVGVGDLTRYGLNILLYVIAYSAVRTEEQGVRVIWALVIGTGVTAVLGFAIGGTLEARPQDDRLASTVGNANELAAVLVAGVALAAGLGFSSRESTGKRMLALAITVISLVALVLTGSRSGVIALALSLITFVFLAGRWRPQVLLGVVTVSFAVVVLFFAFAPQPVRDRITQITPGEISASQEGRVSIWMAAERMVQDNPVKGVGVGNFQARSKDYVLEPGAAGRTDQVIDDPQVAHNTYLQVLAELGIVGAIPFLAIIAFSVWAAYSAARIFERLGNPRLEILCRSLIVALVGTLAANFFASEMFNKLFWLLMALGPAYLAIAKRQQALAAQLPDADAPDAAAGADPPQRALVSS